jgi:hypothetical protein
MANGTLAASQIEMLSQSGTGIMTIVPPATNTNQTLTLPDSTGTVATAESTLAQFNASGSAPVFAARAWVNFNGTGTVAIRASGNVSSITDNSTGNYTVNFTTAMPDANYAAMLTAGQGTANGLDDASRNLRPVTTGFTTTSYQFGVTNAADNAFADANIVEVAVFR